MRLPRPRRLLPLVLLLVLAAPVVANAHGNGTAPRPEAPGPFAVGRFTVFEVDEGRERTLPVDVWYPVDPEDAAGPASAYDLLFTQLVSERAFASPEASLEGPFPLVVFSHGNNGIRFQSYFLCEQLASHGFVVAAPDHVGNTAVDLLIPGPPFTITDRPLDVSFVISRMLARSLDPADPLHGRVDPTRIGVAGHSFGGFTTLAVAAGFGGVPADPRVSAIVPISPVSTILSEAELAGILLPTLIVGGTSDTTTPVDPQSAWAYQHVSGRPLYRLDVLEAGHNSFTDICAIGEALIDAGLPPSLLGFLLGNLEEGCSPELVDVAEAHRLTNRYVVSFMQAILAGDSSYLPFLKPQHQVPGVILFVSVACTSGMGGLAFVSIFLVLGASARRRR